MTSVERMKAEAAKRDAEHHPLPPIVLSLGYTSWTEWADAMTQPSPWLQAIPWKKAE